MQHVSNKFFGFVTGSDEDKMKGNIISSFDGYISYLLIVDDASK